jgi:hypothetical protein
MARPLTAADLRYVIPENMSLDELSKIYLANSEEKNRRAILAEARRLRERLSSIPWYANKAQKSGGLSWLQLAISYAGDD